MNTMTAVTLLTCIGFATEATAQRPDFSGRWSAEPEQVPTGQGARPAGTAGSGWGATITIAQDANRLTVEVPFFSRYDMQPPIRYTFALDGGESVNTLLLGRGVERQRARAVWSDSVLTITTVVLIPSTERGRDPLTTELVQRLTLQSPNTLQIETTRPGVLGGSAMTTRTIYRKQ